MYNNEKGIVKQDINSELQRVLTDAGLNKDKLKEIYENALKFATEKKDVTNLLKIADKIEVANNLKPTEVKQTERVTEKITEVSGKLDDIQAERTYTITRQIDARDKAENTDNMTNCENEPKSKG